MLLIYFFETIIRKATWCIKTFKTFWLRKFIIIGFVIIALLAVRAVKTGLNIASTKKVAQF